MDNLHSVSLTITLQKYLKSMINREEVPYNPARMLMQITHVLWIVAENNVTSHWLKYMSFPIYLSKLIDTKNI